MKINKIIPTILITILFSVVISSKVTAHHSFNSEFEADLEGEVEGVVRRVIWANPHIHYFVEMTLPDGSNEIWSLDPPGNLASYRRENWTRETIQEGDTVRARGNLGRDGAKKLYALCITLESGRQIGRCVTASSETEVTADPAIDYTIKTNDYNVDISGFWTNRYKFRVTVDDFEPSPMPHTPESAAIYASRQYGDDPALRCVPVGLPRLFGSPYAMQIVDAGTHYLMIYLQENAPRWVYMDNRDPFVDQPLSTMGFSVGRWEGRTLVIETSHLLPGWLDGSGYAMSGGDDTRIVERWTIAEDGLSIDRSMTIYDSLYTQPLIRTRGSQRGDDQELLESPACDPTSFYNEMLERGELETLLQNSMQE
ncbi:DUF6152 family protein [Gammaproteobacteria bacterium]|jgi:hypothetical protein|nr:DUF6152 family protein [Gammaproteobacteria bacterium]